MEKLRFASIQLLEFREAPISHRGFRAGLSILRQIHINSSWQRDGFQRITSVWNCIFLCEKLNISHFGRFANICLELSWSSQHRTHGDHAQCIYALGYVPYLCSIVARSEHLSFLATHAARRILKSVENIVWRIKKFLM